MLLYLAWAVGSQSIVRLQLQTLHITVGVALLTKSAASKLQSDGTSLLVSFTCFSRILLLIDPLSFPLYGL